MSKDANWLFHLHVVNSPIYVQACFPIGSGNRGGGTVVEINKRSDSTCSRYVCFRIRWPAATAATATRSQSRSSLGSAVNTLKHLERSCWVSRLVRRVPDATEHRDRGTTRIPPLVEPTCPTPTRLPTIDRSAMDPTSRCVFQGLVGVVWFLLADVFAGNVHV